MYARACVFVCVIPVDKDSVQAGLVIFKPIKMNQNQNLPSGGGGLSSQSVNSVLQNFNQQQFRPQNGNSFVSGGSGNGPVTFPSTFSGFQGSVNRYPNQQQPGGYSLFQDPSVGYVQNGGYPGAQAAAYQFPTGGGGSGESFESFPATGLAAAGQASYGLQNFGFPQPANSHEFNRQLAAFAGHASYATSQEAVGGGGGGASYGDGSDQHDSASDSEEHVAQPSNKNTRHVQAAQQPKRHRGTPATATKAVDHFLPTTARYTDDDGAGAAVSDRASHAGKRSVPKRDDIAVPAQVGGGIVPLKYQHDGSSAEDQARLKKTVQRFFSMLQKQPCEYTTHTLPLPGLTLCVFFDLSPCFYN